MTLRFGEMTAYVIDTVEDETVLALESNVGTMYINVPNVHLKAMMTEMIGELGVAFGNFDFKGEELVVTSKYEVPDYVEPTEEEAAFLVHIKEEMEEFADKKFNGIEVRGEAGWSLPCDSRRYFGGTYVTNVEGGGYIEIDVEQKRVRAVCDISNEMVGGLWFDAMTEFEAFRLDFRFLLEDAEAWMVQAKSSKELEENLKESEQDA